MAKQFAGFEDAHLKFIEAQHMFFVGSAAASGRVNISPKGQDSLRVLGANRLIWLNLTGSGNETAGHLLDQNRMTVMWCSFTTKPMILRAYGSAKTIHPRDAAWDALIKAFPEIPGARQIYDMSIDMVQTSCGYAVPFFDNPRPRSTLTTWAEDRGPEGIKAYWDEKNRETIDGFPTGVIA